MKLLKWCFLGLLPICGWGAYVPHCRIPGEFTVEGEWIYFSPSSETTYFAQNFNIISTSTTPPVSGPNGSKFGNRFDEFHSGWRVGTSYSFCQCDAFLSLSYSQLKTHHSRFLQSSTIDLQNTILPGIVATSAYTTADAFKKFSYYNFEGVIGETFIDHCCFHLDGFAGVHYAHFLTRETYFFNRLSAPLANAQGTFVNTFWGIGPELGLALDGKLGCGFSLRGQAITAFLAGRPELSIESSSFFTTPQRIVSMELHEERIWRLVPFADIKLGAAYDFNLTCSWFSCLPRGLRGGLEVGYEAMTYFNGLARLRVPVDPSVAIDEYRNVTMHGPYIAASLKF